MAEPTHAGPIEVPAPAKLNLFLHVIGRRGDGYHEIESVFVPLDFGDRLTLAVRVDGGIVRTGRVAAIDPQDDLAVRAAQLLQARSATTLGVDIAIMKRIPLGGGLGGGSSDAATVLLALNRLWGLDWSRAKLCALGAELGADVPFFVFGEPAFASGTGATLRAVTVPPTWFAIVAPRVEVSTAAVFAAPELTRDTQSEKIIVFSEGYGRNDLQAVAASRFPEVAAVLHGLGSVGNARMTGSGACVFAPFDREIAAHNALRCMPEGTAGFVARALNAHPLRGFANS